MGRSASGNSGLAKNKSPPNHVSFMHGPRNRYNSKSPSNTGVLNIAIGRSNYEDSESSEDSEDSEEDVTVSESESESESEVSEPPVAVKTHPMTLRPRAPKVEVLENKKKFRDHVMKIGKKEKKGRGKFQIQQSAVDVLQNVAEQGLVDLFSKSGALAKTRGRQKVTVTDMHAALEIMNVLQNSSD